MLADAANDYLESMAPPESKTKENKPAAAVLELNFTILKI